MIKYQDYNEYFQELNLSEDEGKIITEYLIRLIDIVIEKYDERR